MLSLLPALALVLSLAEPPAPPASDQVGVVFVVGGIGGADPLGISALLALPWAGVPHEIREYRWTHGLGRLVKDLQDRPWLLAHANELAEQVAMYQAQHPGHPVYLVGHSAGAALILATAAQLPPDSIERIIILAAAVAPDYDLCAALRATRTDIVSFRSDMDRLWLGAGTTLLGSADRCYGTSAGCVGFVEPAGLDEVGRQRYQRLVQIPWRPALLWEANFGAHHGCVRPDFLSRYVAPWLMPAANKP
jgi:pimeloyl-ACP methyl ester carboxylesterase